MNEIVVSVLIKGLFDCFERNENGNNWNLYQPQKTDGHSNYLILGAVVSGICVYDQ